MEHLTLDQCREYLLKNTDLVNLHEVSRRLKMDWANFYKGLHGKPGSKGSIAKIPEKHLPTLQAIIAELQIES